jgi:hypothetical protein
MRIPKMTRIRARALFEAGIRTAEDLAKEKVEKVILIFRNCNAWLNKKRALTAGAEEKANFIETKIAKSAIKRAAIHANTHVLRGDIARQMEIQMGKEHRKARTEREAKKSNK